MSILNRTAVRDRLIAEYHKCYRGTINVKDRVTADTIARVEAAALREIELIAKANFGPGKTITARGS